jgi:hypothetical protein
MAEATATTKSILMSARSEETAVREETRRLKQSRLRLFDDVRATLQACQEWLATVDPRRRGGEARNALSGPVPAAVSLAD